MRILARSTLQAFWRRHPEAESALRAWFKEVRQASWKSPSDLKIRYPQASLLAGGRVVFNIKGNHFRLIAAIRFDLGIVFIRFIGTHQEYDEVDATTV